MKFDIHKKEREGLLYGEKIVRHSKLKLWTFFWGHGEHEWPLESCWFAHCLSMMHGTKKTDVIVFIKTIKFQNYTKCSSIKL